MKKLNSLLLSLFAILLVACAGSDTYRGSWKAMNAEGGKFEISFEPKTFSVKDSLGQTKKYDYSQKSVKIENSIKTYGIALADGRNYQVHFPRADNDSIGLMRDENGNPLFTIARNRYVTYDDIYKLE